MGEVEQDVQRRLVIIGRHIGSSAALLTGVTRHVTGMEGMRVGAWPVVFDVVILADGRQDGLEHHAQNQ